MGLECTAQEVMALLETMHGEEDCRDIRHARSGCKGYVLEKNAPITFL